MWSFLLIVRRGVIHRFAALSLDCQAARVFFLHQYFVSLSLRRSITDRTSGTPSHGYLTDKRIEP